MWSSLEMLASPRASYFSSSGVALSSGQDAGESQAVDDHTYAYEASSHTQSAQSAASNVSGVCRVHRNRSAATVGLLLPYTVHTCALGPPAAPSALFSCYTLTRTEPLPLEPHPPRSFCPPDILAGRAKRGDLAGHLAPKASHGLTSLPPH